MPKKPTYQDNYKKGIRLLMAEKPELADLRKVSEYLDINYMTLYKIMDGGQNPTTDQCIALCKKCGYSANWMFLNEGGEYLKEQATLNEILIRLR